MRTPKLKRVLYGKKVVYTIKQIGKVLVKCHTNVGILCYKFVHIEGTPLKACVAIFRSTVHGA